MKRSLLRPHSFLLAFAPALAALTLLVAAPPAAATTELLRSGPVLAGGFSPDEDASGDSRTLAQGAVGWRFVYEDFDWSRSALGAIGTNLDFVIEPLFGVLGDSETTTVELSVVPLLHLEPANAERWFPYFEGGIGLIYNDLRGYDLGSQILFSDNAGVGIGYRTDDGKRISFGYRFRHISHAGLWAEANDGLNSHFFVLSVEMP